MAAAAFSLLIGSGAASAADLLTADAIAQRYVDARGGYDRIQAIRTVIFRGTYREGGHVSPHAALSLMRPYYKLVGDAEQRNRGFAEGYDGSTWEYYPDPGIVLRTVGAASAAGRHATTIDGPLIDYRSRGWTLALRGIEAIDGRPAYRLHLRMSDGFEQDEFIDAKSFLLIAERKSAPIHAFGSAVASEQRIGEYRAFGGVLFPCLFREAEVTTGKVLNEVHWSDVVVNHDLNVREFSPPTIERSPAQQLLDQLFLERSDAAAVMWSYRDFRRVHPEIDVEQGIEFVGYQMAKAGAAAGAIGLLQANAAEHPASAAAAFGLGRAYEAAGDVAAAKRELRRALMLDPNDKRAAAEVARLP